MFRMRRNPCTTRVCQVLHPAPLTEEAEGHPLTNLVPTPSLSQALLVMILSPCPTAPEGYNWDGTRVVRNKKGSKRPPDTSSEEWRNMSRNLSKGIRLSLSERQPLVLRKRGMQPQLCQRSSVLTSHFALRWRPYTGRSWVNFPSSHMLLWLGWSIRLKLTEHQRPRRQWIRNGRSLLISLVGCTRRFESFGMCLLKRFGKGSRRTSEGSLRFAASRAMSFLKVTQTESGGA